jgi:hypothetical protein
MAPVTAFCPNLACHARGWAGSHTFHIYVRRNRRFLCAAHWCATPAKQWPFRGKMASSTTNSAWGPSGHGVKRVGHLHSTTTCSTRRQSHQARCQPETPGSARAARSLWSGSSATAKRGCQLRSP